jgi:hypothetical protein
LLVAHYLHANGVAPLYADAFTLLYRMFRGTLGLLF